MVMQCADQRIPKLTTVQTAAESINARLKLFTIAPKNVTSEDYINGDPQTAGEKRGQKLYNKFTPSSD